MGISFFNPILTLFVGQPTPLLCYLVVSAMLSFDLCLLDLFWACCTLSLCSVPVTQYYHWACTHIVMGFLGPFHPFGASLAHFIPLGIFSLFHFLGHPWPSPILHSHGFLLSLLGFLPKLPYLLLSEFIGFSTNPIYLIPSFGLLRPIFSCFPFLIMPMGLLFLSSSSFGPACFLWGHFTILEAYGPLFLPFNLNGFLLNLLILLLYSLSYCWTSSYYWAFLHKWASIEFITKSNYKFKLSSFSY